MFHFILITSLQTMYRFCKEKVHVDMTTSLWALLVNNTSKTILYNVLLARVSENTWNLATVNFASSVKQREWNKEIRPVKVLNSANWAFDRSNFDHEQYNLSELFIKVWDLSSKTHLLFFCHTLIGEMSDCTCIEYTWFNWTEFRTS